MKLNPRNASNTQFPSTIQCVRDFVVIYTTEANTTLTTIATNTTITTTTPIVKFKETDCFESQILRKRNEHVNYIVDLISSTPNVPYGDSFSIEVKYCLSYVSKEECRLLMTSQVRIIKSFMMKGIVKAAVSKGCDEMTISVVKLLQSYANKEDKKENEVTTAIQTSPILQKPESPLTEAAQSKRRSSETSPFSLENRSSFFFLVAAFLCVLMATFVLLFPSPYVIQPLSHPRLPRNTPALLYKQFLTTFNQSSSVSPLFYTSPNQEAVFHKLNKVQKQLQILTLQNEKMANWIKQSEMQIQVTAFHHWRLHGSHDTDSSVVFDRKNHH